MKRIKVIAWLVQPGYSMDNMMVEMNFPFAASLR
jgi:hypothetical protein